MSEDYGDLLPRSLRIATYRFEIVALEPMLLPPTIGSTLRGGFGSALRHIACAEPAWCRNGCVAGNACPFGYLLETSPPDGSPSLRKLREVPRPFVIRPPLKHAPEVARGEQLTFELILVGRAIDYLAYFVLGFRHLGRTGLGANRARFELTRVEAMHEGTGAHAAVFESSDAGRLNLTALAIDTDWLLQGANPSRREHVDLELLTPMRLKAGQGIVHEPPPFRVLVSRLLGRISALALVHCNEQWSLRFRELLAAADEVATIQADTRWHAWHRVSRRQGRSIAMGGVVGTVRYQAQQGADLEPFLPVLRAGALVHVGRGAVFGNGRYQLRS